MYWRQGYYETMHWSSDGYSERKEHIFGPYFIKILIVCCGDRHVSSRDKEVFVLLSERFKCVMQKEESLQFNKCQEFHFRSGSDCYMQNIN